MTHRKYQYPVGTIVAVVFDKWIGLGKIIKQDPPAVVIQGRHKLAIDSGTSVEIGYWEARRLEADVFTVTSAVVAEYQKRRETIEKVEAEKREAEEKKRALEEERNRATDRFLSGGEDW